MGSNSQETTPVKKQYTSGIRSQGGTGKVNRFDNPKEAYNNSYNDVWAKFNGKSSWVKPNMNLFTYISKYAPAEDNNDPVKYTSHMVSYLNKSLGKNIITKDSTLYEIKESLIKAGLDPEHTITKAHLSIEDPSVIKDLNL